MLQTPVGTHAIEPRRIAATPKLRRDLIDDYATDDPDRNVRARRPSGVRITLPGGISATILGRIAIGIMVAAMFGTFAALLWGARHYLLADSRLVLASSSSIQIIGNQHLTRAQLLSVFGEDIDRNLLTIPLTERREELERLPWVYHATVMRLLPNRLRIAITERTPVAFYRQGSHVGLVDSSGVLLDFRPETAGSTPGETIKEEHYSFPVVSGVAANDPPTMRATRMNMFGRFMTELRGSGDGIADRLSEVDLSSPEDVKALISTGSKDVLVHFGQDHFLERYRRFEENLPKWKSDYPKLASADMRYPRQVVLEMAPGTAVPVASSHTLPDTDTNAKAAVTPAKKRITTHPPQVKRVPTAPIARSHLQAPDVLSTAPGNYLHAGPQ